MRWRRRDTGGTASRRRCGACAHFDNAPAALEKIFANLAAVSSGYASVRAEDGLCRIRDIYLSARANCPDFVRREGGSPDARTPTFQPGDDFSPAAASLGTPDLRSGSL